MSSRIFKSKIISTKNNFLFRRIIYDICGLENITDNMTFPKTLFEDDDVKINFILSWKYLDIYFRDYFYLNNEPTKTVLIRLFRTMLKINGYKMTQSKLNHRMYLINIIKPLTNVETKISFD